MVQAVQRSFKSHACMWEKRKSFMISRWGRISSFPPGSRVSGEGCVSDDEMVTLSADTLENYGSDYEMTIKLRQSCKPSFCSEVFKLACWSHQKRECIPSKAIELFTYEFKPLNALPKRLLKRDEDHACKSKKNAKLVTRYFPVRLFNVLQRLT